MYYVCAPLSWQVPKSHSLPFIMCRGIKHLFQVMFYSWENIYFCKLQTSFSLLALPFVSLGSLPRRWVLQVLVGSCHHALQPCWGRHRLCSLSWLQVTQFGFENLNATFLVGFFCNPSLCYWDRNLAASVRRNTLYFAEVQRILFLV